MPWGAMNIPAPKLFSRFPCSSNLSIGGIFLISPVVRSRQLLAPHRSATHNDLPSLSMSTALVDPHFLPSGSLAQPSTVRYGFGASLVGASDCAHASQETALIATIAAVSMYLICIPCGIKHLPHRLGVPGRCL